MKEREYEIHASVSYISGGTRYYDVYLEYIKAVSKTEARKAYKAELAKDGIRVEHMDIIEA